jgi:hypothetical protein
VIIATLRVSAMVLSRKIIAPPGCCRAARCGNGRSGSSALASLTISVHDSLFLN